MSDIVKARSYLVERAWSQTSGVYSCLSVSAFSDSVTLRRIVSSQNERVSANHNKMTSLLFSLLLCYCERKDPVWLLVLEVRVSGINPLIINFLPSDNKCHLCLAAHIVFMSFRKATLAEGNFTG